MYVQIRGVFIDTLPPYVLPPHTLEPTYPGAYETIHSLCECWDDRQLYDNRKAVMGLVAQCGKLHKSASSYLYAAGSLLGQLQQMADEQTDHAKVLRLAASLAARELHPTGHPGSEKVRFVSGITNQGLYCFEETIAALCPRRIAIDDSWGSASSLLLSTLRQLALENGHHIITCACPLSPFTKIDHLLLPELGLAFVTQNKLHPLTLSVERTIHARRFLNLERLRQKKHRMAFLQRAAFNMLDQAGNLIGEAKETHDLLEMYYITAMDFHKVNVKSEELIDRFRKMADG